MAILKEQDRNALKKRFEALKNEVRLIYFTQELECQFCRETHQILDELAGLSDLLSLEVLNFAIDKEKAGEFKIDKIPATVIAGVDKDYGIRYFGVPSGYEFASLIEAILDVSRGETELSAETKDKLKQITKPVHIQTFVTPTCPYCPQAVRLAAKMAIENDFIRAETIETAEFPHLVHKYNVLGVPKVVINEKIQFEGALPEPQFIDQVMKVLKD